MAPNATHHFSCHSQKHHAKKKKAEIFGVEPQSPGLSLDVSQGLQLTKFDQVEELELVAPWSLGLFSCFLAGTCSTRKYQADSLFVKAIGMIPLRTQDSLDVFTERVKMLEADMNDGQRRLLIMTQVKVKLNEGDLPAAGKVYQKLKKLAPQSEEVIEARELIKAAVIKRKGD